MMDTGAGPPSEYLLLAIFLVQQWQSRVLRDLTSPWRQAPDVTEPRNCATLQRELRNTKESLVIIGAAL